MTSRKPITRDDIEAKLRSLQGDVNDQAEAAKGTAITVAGVVGSDLVKSYTQYAFWRGMVAPLMEGPTYVVPVPGNHEYHTPHAGAYYAYFCGSSGTTFQGYYSFELGTWHVLALNTNIEIAAGSPEETWVRAPIVA